MESQAPQDDLTAERAAIALLEQMGLYGHPAASQFIGDILAALQTTRQEALREAARVAHETNEEEPFQTYVILEALDRLASEGAAHSLTSQLGQEEA